MTNLLNQYLSELPLIAILRGITAQQSESVVEAVYAAGFRMVEVPLNSPDPLDSIERIAKQFGDDMLVGAGTVLSTDQVTQVKDRGGQLIVSPNTDISVIEASVALGMATIPGAATPSEAFVSIAAGAHAVKVFPAEMITPSVLSSWRAVLPPSTALLPVGGINHTNMPDYWQAGASGFGLGGSLYKPTLSLGDVSANATKLAWSMTSMMKT